MSNKYYVPKIEDLCVGVHYERYQEDMGEWGWYPTKVNYWDNLRELYDLLGDKLDSDDDNGLILTKIRIKYLDDLNIKDCGFIKQSEGNFTNEKGNIQIICDYINHIVTVLTKEYQSNLCMTEKEPEEYWYPRFVGYIYNENEFRRMLKQIGIRK